jgi:hypothetical protein
MARAGISMVDDNEEAGLMISEQSCRRFDPRGPWTDE